MSTKSKTRETSKPAILAAAVSLAKKHGLRNFSREQVAKASKMAEATVSFHFGNMDELRKEVVKAAIAGEVLSILADARADRKSSELYTGMTAELKKRVANYIAA
jgi:AcrR family transcriptional regulator